jgi:hypothetical protein
MTADQTVSTEQRASLPLNKERQYHENTGKKLTKEQIESVKANLNRPVMYMTGGHRMGGDESLSAAGTLFCP